MKRGLRIALPLLLIAGAVAVGIYVSLLAQPEYSSNQSDIIRILGNPDQFVITYLPRGEKELVRSEVWLYPTAGKRVGFSGGNLAYIEDYEPAAVVTPADFSPADFYYGQSRKDIDSVLGTEVEEGVFIPGLTDASIYYSPKALYILDKGNLTYFQTLGVGDKSYLDGWEKEQQKLEATPTPTPASRQKYVSTDIGISLEYPADWFLSNGVLSSYDTGYMEKNLPLPDKRLKCDFVPYDGSAMKIDNLQAFADSPVRVQKGMAVALSEESGPGLGDAVIFLIGDESRKQMTLLCYSYHPDFEPQLKQMFSTFSFTTP